MRWLICTLCALAFMIIFNFCCYILGIEYAKVSFLSGWLSCMIFYEVKEFIENNFKL